MAERGRLPAVVVGAGPAGLATSAALRARGVAHVVLEREETVGATWHRLYDGLTLHTGKHLSALPGMPFPRGTPLFPGRAAFCDYLAAYAARFAGPVELGCGVDRIARAPGGWTLETSRGRLDADAVVVATGIVANPHLPTWPGQDRFRGALAHAVSYRRPALYVGRRVLVVGVGNSGAEIAAQLAAAGARVSVAVRSGAHVVPLRLLGIPIQYWSAAIQTLPASIQRALAAAAGLVTRVAKGPPVLPRPRVGLLDRPPVIGDKLVDALRAGRIALRPDVARFTEEGVVFADGRAEAFDAVLLATGYRAALGPLGALVGRDEKGFARRDGVRSLDQPGLYFVGHHYGTDGALRQIGKDGVRAAALVARGAA
jgi:cation diffusion facilitator CzcD-associated flavoprotein CzcO